MGSGQIFDRLLAIGLLGFVIGLLRCELVLFRF